jgi:Spy/CpxP family protein refolding chaperone
MGKWWKDPGMAQVLELSAEQIVQIEQIAFEHRLKLINLRAALETAEVQLEGLLEADHPDEAKVAAQIDQVALARGNVEKQNAMLMLAVRRVITLLQWKRLQAIQQERERRMRPGMPPQPMPNPEGAAPPRPPDA